MATSYVNKKRSEKGRGLIFQNMTELEAYVSAELSELFDEYIAEVAKDVVKETLDTNVYSYSPSPEAAERFPRRYTAGGMADEGNIYVSVSGGGSQWIMRIRDMAKWQNSNPRAGSMRLDDAIESGKHQWGAGARPFYEDADKRLEEIIEREVSELCAGI